MKAAGAILGLVSVATAQHLQRRVGQSTAVCQQGFSWAATQVSPCQAVADLDAQCNNGNWVIPALNSSFHYTSPAGNTSTFCTCSWASYNLLSACIACQGFPEQIPAWGSYSIGCAGQLTTDSFFPTNFTLPSTIRIPFWAQMNPTQWPGQIFNANQAQQIAAENHPDFVGGTPTPKVGETKKKSNAGAIAGGVIGGLIVIGAAVAIALWMVRRSRRPVGVQQLHTGAELIQRPSHMRSMSEISTFKAPENIGYNNLSGGTMNGGNGGGLMLPTSPTIQTHFTGSTRSVPYMSTVVGGASTAPYGTTASSPPPVPRVPTPGAGGSTRREDMVTPFTSLPSLDANMDRKNPNGAFPVYGDPNAPHPNTTSMRMEIVRPRTPVPRNAQRFNPPAYEASSPGGAASSSGRPEHSHNRSKQGSTDTTHSMTSSRNGMPGQTPGHSPNTSISVPGIAEQMNTLPPTTPPQAQHGRKVSASTRDVKARPGDDAFSARDIA